ncbi:MAG: TolC family protein [Acidobacteriaceae bacterium]|nr:TolC family protein [Acidobacteriaceae bacterium]
MSIFSTRLLLPFALVTFASAQVTTTPVTTDNGAPAAQPQQQPASQQPTPPGVEPRIHELPDSFDQSNTPVVPADAPTLTLAQAEQLALAHNPRINIARLTALAQGEVTRENRAAYMPTLSAAATAVQADNGGRLTAGALNNPVLYTRAAFGATLNQLLTDFGRTRNLVASASLRAKAADSTLAATHDDILFAVETTFYRALGAQALIGVAQQNVRTRRATANQIGALTKARLRSTLDLSFANADLAQAQLQLLDARNNSVEAQAALSALLGDENSTVYRLVDETPNHPAFPPAEAAPLVTLAFKSRPDLRSLNQTAQAEHNFAKAEHNLSLPSISALGAVGTAPTHDGQITQNVYGAVGVNLSVPVFNGFLYSARYNEAKLQAKAADEHVRQAHDTIARDVTTTVLQAQSNFNRIAVAEQLAQQSSTALKLAKTRYDLGLSSIVELSQAQLLDTQAQIQLTSARYSYQGSLAAIRYQTGQ